MKGKHDFVPFGEKKLTFFCVHKCWSKATEINTNICMDFRGPWIRPVAIRSSWRVEVGAELGSLHSSWFFALLFTPLGEESCTPSGRAGATIPVAKVVREQWGCQGKKGGEGQWEAYSPVVLSKDCAYCFPSDHYKTIYNCPCRKICKILMNAIQQTAESQRPTLTFSSTWDQPSRKCQKL